MIWIYREQGGVPDSLVAAFYAFAGGEAGFLGLIKHSDNKYNGSGGGTRLGLIAVLEEMRGYLEQDEDELLNLTDSSLSKLRAMSDSEFDALDLYPDFDMEETAYAE